jgi:hypothetical protein
VFKEATRSQSLLKRALFYWDIILLSLIILAFSIYLTFFLRIYLATDEAEQQDFYARVNLAYSWLVGKWLKHVRPRIDDITTEECVLYSPDLTSAVARPVEDCSMCAQPLTHIDRISNISKADFLTHYAYTGVPVIITDAINEWSALSLFTFAFLKDLYLNVNQTETRAETERKRLVELNELTLLRKFGQMVGNSERGGKYEKLTCQFFPYKTKFKSLRQVFDRVERDYDAASGKWQRPWYVGWSNCNDHVSKVLRRHYARPYFLPDESEMSKLDWIFMGTPGYGADIHIDDVSNPSWQAQIGGVKHWTFKPPAECLHKCPWTLTADVRPGDIIIFDSNRWFHSTEIVGDELSLTIGSEYD